MTGNYCCKVSGALERRPPTWRSPSCPKSGCNTNTFDEERIGLGGDEVR